jgi:ATP-dependent RNA helicase DHX57
MGAILGCRDAALSMAAGMSTGRSPLLRIDTFHHGKSRNTEDEIESIEVTKQRRVLEERSILFKTVGNSDHALLACIFLKWKSLQTGDLRKRFCESLGLSFVAMKDISQLVNQLDTALVMAGFSAAAESESNNSSWRIVHACAVAAMAPSQLVKVQRPAAKYTETLEGAVAKDGEARELKFFIRTECARNSVTSTEKEERVFIHPSSINFGTGNFTCPFLVFNSLVTTSKPFLRDVTECSTYALLLFGGAMEVQASKGVIVLDKWATLAANARIGSLMGGLRKKVDSLLAKKITDPFMELSTTSEMKLIVKLIRTDGLGA